MRGVGTRHRWPGWGPAARPALKHVLIQQGCDGCQPVLPRGRGATRAFGNGLTNEPEHGLCSRWANALSKACVSRALRYHVNYGLSRPAWLTQPRWGDHRQTHRCGLEKIHRPRAACPYVLPAFRSFPVPPRRGRPPLHRGEYGRFSVAEGAGLSFLEVPVGVAGHVIPGSGLIKEQSVLPSRCQEASRAPKLLPPPPLLPSKTQPGPCTLTVPTAS